MDRSTFSIIGDRYLDTQFDNEYIESLEQELKARGVTGIRRLVFEYIAASSLWWNIMWWDWTDLNEKDIKIGWRQNIVAFGLIAVPIAIFVSLWVGIVTFLVLHAITTWIGLGLRDGSKLNK